MPVFVVVRARRAHAAAHPDQRGTIPGAAAVEGEDFYQRVGTAVRTPEGGYRIDLTALPVGGALLMRPPRPGESLDPTLGGGR
jgi:hypothetical protein